MAFEHLTNMTAEEKLEAKRAALEERQRIIQQAIQNGATVNYLSARITSEEWETIISYGYDGICTIDTTIPSDITKCIKRGWKITSVTYYKDSKIVAGITCEATNKQISILSNK